MIRKAYHIIRSAALPAVMTACCLLSCKDPYKNEVFMAYDEVPIGLWLEERPEYSMWVEMLKEADLFNALNLATMELTCFVADNEAVDHYVRNVAGYGSYKDMDPEELDYLMRYHIVPGAKLMSANLMLKLSLPTASGDYLTAGMDIETDVRYIDNGADKQPSNIVRKDIEMSNGVVHHLDRMLQPISETVWDVLTASSRYTIFNEALEAAGLDLWLDNVEREVFGYTVREYKTVFAVSDSVYNEQGIHSLSDLQGLFPGDPLDTESRFHQYLLYHTMDKLKGYADLTVFPEGYNSMIIYTCSSLKGLCVLDQGGDVWFNPQEENFRILSSHRDIPARNGYIHEVDNIMALPSEMARYVVEWEPTDKFEFTAIPCYRIAKDGDDPADRFFIEQSEVPGIRWESIPETKAQVWYHSENIGDGRYLYNDALYWDLGDIGWIELDIPVLPAGTWQLRAHKSNHDNGGRATAQWSGRNANEGNTINFVSGADYANWNNQTFTGEQTHTIKFTVTEHGGWMGIDRFVFLPID